jgi:hypothetical protein
MTKQDAKAIKILENWIEEFHNYEDKFDCIEIIHDGFAENDDGSENEDEPRYAVFINKASHLVEQFPPLDRAVMAFASFVIHRDEDFCIYVYLNTKTGNIDINIPDDQPNKLTWKEASKNIIAIDKKYSA